MPVLSIFVTVFLIWFIFYIILKFLFNINVNQIIIPLGILAIFIGFIIWGFCLINGPTRFDTKVAKIETLELVPITQENDYLFIVNELDKNIIFRYKAENGIYKTETLEYVKLYLEEYEFIENANATKITKEYTNSFVRWYCGHTASIQYEFNIPKDKVFYIR